MDIVADIAKLPRIHPKWTNTGKVIFGVKTRPEIATEARVLAARHYIALGELVEYAIAKLLSDISAQNTARAA